MTRPSTTGAARTPRVRPPALTRLPTLIVHGAAQVSAPQADSDDVMDRSGASYQRTARRYEQEEDEGD
jgi:hypothetical protein